MMEKITLAIPFYNTSEYFKETIQYATEDNFVSEIIVNDDHSTEDEWKSLNDIVNSIDCKKIKTFRNEQNLGGFRNKYVTVQKSTNDWIYLLDSDNHLTDYTLNAIKTIENPDSNICYCPEKLLLHNDENGYESEAIYNFRYDKVGVEESKDGIIKRTKWFDWFLNTGNYVFNRETYLEFARSPFEDTSTKLLHADVMAFSYFWLGCGGEFQVVPNFHYYHRLRSSSYWNACGSDSSASAELYKSMILDL